MHGRSKNFNWFWICLFALKLSIIDTAKKEILEGQDFRSSRIIEKVKLFQEHSIMLCPRRSCSPARISLTGTSCKPPKLLLFIILLKT